MGVSEAEHLQVEIGCQRIRLSALQLEEDAGLHVCGGGLRIQLGDFPKLFLCQLVTVSIHQEPHQKPCGAGRDRIEFSQPLRPLRCRLSPRHRVQVHRVMRDGLDRARVNFDRAAEFGFHRFPVPVCTSAKDGSSERAASKA